MADDGGDAPAPVPAPAAAEQGGSKIEMLPTEGPSDDVVKPASGGKENEAEEENYPLPEPDAPPPPRDDEEDEDEEPRMPMPPDEPPQSPPSAGGGDDGGDDGSYDGGGAEEEEEAADEEAALVADFASHPMMDRVQKVLIETLRRELERTTLAARERGHEASLASRKREDVGVELYGAQQQLARLQLNLEKMHSDSAGLVEDRTAKEVDAHKHKQAHAALAKALAERRKHLAKSQSELDAINDTLRQVAKYNEEMRKEIAVSKRATYKAEENVQEKEKRKTAQDLYIDKLDQRVRALGEAIAVHDAQLDRQRAESAEAREMLKETGQEMELIAFEKKQLIQQWKAALIQLTRRDEALAAAQTTLNSARMELQDLQTEIEGTRRDVTLASNETASLDALREKHTKEESALDLQIGKLDTETQAGAAQYQLLERSMAHTEEEEARIRAEGKTAGESLGQLDANLQIVTVERHKVEMKILQEQSSKTTVSKAVRNVKQQVAKVLKKSHVVEMEHAHLENELARVRVDALNTEAHNDQLKATLEAMLAKLQAQDDLIAKYQQEIRQRNDDIEKKMYRVDRLNRKYEKMTESVDPGESLGPLEATIRNLQKERDSVQAAIVDLQTQWLNDQTALVNCTQDAEQTLEQTSELRARERILNEKRLQLLKSEEAHQQQVAALEQNVKSMRADVARLNDLLGQYARREGLVANDTAVMEMEFHAELKELERKALEDERKVQETRAARQLLLADIVETERQVMLWEKKIQIERETQAALDPNVGHSEVHAMEIEIHRMRLRLDALHREQEKMIKEMERGISKRETITLRFQTKDPSGTARTTQHKGIQAQTKAALKKQVAKLRASIAQTARDASNLSNDIQQRQRSLEDSTTALAAATAEYGELEAEAQALQAAINTLLYEKQRRAELQASKDQTAQRFLDLERGVIEPLGASDAGSTEARYQAAFDDLKQVRHVIDALRSQFDYLAEPLDRIHRLTEDAEAGYVVGGDNDNRRPANNNPDDHDDDDGGGGGGGGHNATLLTSFNDGDAAPPP